MARKKGKKKNNPEVNKKLEGFNVHIDPFGEIKSTYEIDKLNKFLNKNVKDKKLIDREDFNEMKKEENSDEEE